MQVICALPLEKEQKEFLEEGFTGEVSFGYISSYGELKREEYRHAEVIIGEPPTELLKELDCLKLIQMTWAGADRYAKAAKEIPKGLLISNASGVFGKAISEYVLSGILCLNRKHFEYRERMRAGKWERVNGTRTLEGKNALILGCGDIGTEVARKLSAFDTKCRGIRRHAGSGAAYFVETGDDGKLEEWIKAADLVIGCMPGTDKTEGMLSERILRLCKKDCMLVNVGRGSLFSLEVLVTLLREGRFSGVILDVMETEPLPEDHPLRSIDRVLLTPHISGISWGDLAETDRKILMLAKENLRRFVDGKPLYNRVDLKGGYRDQNLRY